VNLLFPYWKNVYQLYNFAIFPFFNIEHHHKHMRLTVLDNFQTKTQILGKDLVWFNRLL